MSSGGDRDRATWRPGAKSRVFEEEREATGLKLQKGKRGVDWGLSLPRHGSPWRRQGDFGGVRTKNLSSQVERMGSDKLVTRRGETLLLSAFPMSGKESGMAAGGKVASIMCVLGCEK